MLSWHNAFLCHETGILNIPWQVQFQKKVTVIAYLIDPRVLIPVVKCIFLLWSSHLHSFRSLIKSFLVTLWSGLYSIRFVLSSLQSGLLCTDICFPSFFIFSPSSPLSHQAPAGGFPKEHWRPPSFTTLFVQKHQARQVSTEVLVPGVRPLY